MTELRATVGQWYKRLDDGAMFEVVGIDDVDGTIELQDFEGSIDELDREDWFAQSLEEIEPPEDWSGAMDSTAPDAAGSMSDAGTEQAERRDPELLAPEELPSSGTFDDQNLDDDQVSEEYGLELDRSELLSAVPAPPHSQR